MFGLHREVLTHLVRRGADVTTTAQQQLLNEQASAWDKYVGSEEMSVWSVLPLVIIAIAGIISIASVSTSYVQVVAVLSLM